MSNLGLIRISYEDLAGMLSLPKGHVITAIVPPDANGIANQTFMVVVSGPQLPEHYEGSFPPEVSITRKQGKTFLS